MLNRGVGRCFVLCSVSFMTMPASGVWNYLSSSSKCVTTFMPSLHLASPGAPPDTRKLRLKVSRAASERPPADIVLSGGRFAFAAHCGFLEGVERSLTRDRVNSIVATSSGALAGALWAAGYSAMDVRHIIQKESKDGGWLAVMLKGWGKKPWKGRLSMTGLLELLRVYLPATFEELATPLALGVQDATGQRRLLHAGNLPDAVTASLAARVFFAPVEVDGIHLNSMGARDRTGLLLRSKWRSEQQRLLLVHVVDRECRPQVDETSGLEEWIKDPRMVVITSPRSRSSILRGLVDLEVEHIAAMETTLRIVAPWQLHGLPAVYSDDMNTALTTYQVAGRRLSV